MSKKEEVTSFKIELLEIKSLDLAYNPLFFQGVHNLRLIPRTRNCLEKEKMFCIGDLVSKTEQKMLSIPNFGRKCLDEIKEELQKINLKFNMELDQWPPKNLEHLCFLHSMSRRDFNNKYKR